MKKFELPQLTYGYQYFEPFVDAVTMEIHHTRHHAGYINKLNELVEENKVLQKYKTASKILRKFSKLPPGVQDGVRKFAGGHWNHLFFWTILSAADQEPAKHGPTIYKAILENFGSFENFKEQFTSAGMSLFGSGWVWLVALDYSLDLEIITTPNQDSPLMDIYPNIYRPIIGLDLWEHSYYLRHQNRRDQYISHFWRFIDWMQADLNFLSLTGYRISMGKRAFNDLLDKSAKMHVDEFIREEKKRLARKLKEKYSTDIDESWLNP